MKTAVCLIKISRGGTVTIPKEIREYLNLHKGDLVKIDVTKANGGE